MKALSITLKDMHLALQDSGTLIYLFVLPLIFVFLFTGGLNALAGGEAAEVETAGIPLPVANEDVNGALARTLLDNLAAAGSVTLQTTTRTEAEAQMETGRIMHLLLIPASFSADFVAGAPAQLRLINHPNADINETEALRLAVDGVAQDLALEQQLLASLEHMGAMQAAAAPEEPLFATERNVTQARAQFARAQEQPLVSLSQIDPGSMATSVELPDFGDVQIKIPGFAILFAFLAAQAVARSVYDEKKVGSFRRLLAAPLSKSSLLLGKMMTNFIMVLIQFAVSFAVGIFLLPLVGLDRLTLGHDPLALTLLCMLVALCSTSLGVLIAALAHTDNQIGGLSTVIIWGTGVLGGAMIPTFFLGDFLNSVAKVVPQYWAIDAFYDLLVLGQGLPQIAPALLVLLGFSLLFFGLGLWRFKFN